MTEYLCNKYNSTPLVTQLASRHNSTCHSMSSAVTTPVVALLITLLQLVHSSQLPVIPLLSQQEYFSRYIPLVTTVTQGYELVICWLVTPPLLHSLTIKTSSDWLLVYIFHILDQLTQLFYNFIFKQAKLYWSQTLL